MDGIRKTYIVVGPEPIEFEVRGENKKHYEN